jgi:hypothetical protein
MQERSQRSLPERNRIEGEVVGGFGHVLIHNANADGGEIHVTSGRNRYLGPTTGIRVRGGNAFLTDATRNSVILNSINDRFEGMRAGVLVWGRQALIAPTITRLSSGSSEVVSNGRRPPTSGQSAGRGAGENNHVRIFVHGATDPSGMPFIAFDGLSSCGVNNRVEVVGNPEAWETNPEMLPHEP